MSNTRKVWITHSGRLAGALLLTTVFGGGMTPQAALAKSRISYKPGVAIVPEVLQSNGQERTYNTPNGPSLWTDGLPIQQGDKVKLNVFAATGGAELGRIIVRLDNTKIAQIPKAPWNTVLDTTQMTVGPHMIEVFAETKGDHPQSATKTQSFFITDHLAPQFVYQEPAKVLYGGSIQLTGGPETEPGTDPNAVPDVPSFLQGKTVDENATVTVRARSGISPTDPTTGGPIVSDSDTPVVINEPTLFFIQAPQGSTATKYAFVLARNGQEITAATEPQELIYNAIKLQKRDATTVGLSAGPLMLFVWGIDAEGRPSNVVKTQVSIP
jgi:hypothetical protein